MRTARILLLFSIFFLLVSLIDGQRNGNKKRNTRRRRRNKYRKSVNNPESDNGPLMVFMLDGFRWDYVWRLQSRMPGFTRFLSEGVQAEYMEPPFPVVSYAAWTTLSTGLYPESHGILGNYMVDLPTDPTGDELFILGVQGTTKQLHWWQKAEPIWITATRQRKRSFLRYWSRCDVPFNGIFPEECTGYASAGGIQAINKTLNVGLEKFLDGFDLVMVYGEQIDNTGHQYGPDSYEMQLALLELDAVFLEFLEKLDKYPKLKSKLNIIVVSDHGMTDVRPNRGVTYFKLDDFINKNDIFRIMDHATFMSIQPLPGRHEIVMQGLKRIPGVDVYNKEDIPEEFHYKSNNKTLDILLVSRPGTVVLGLQSSKQFPRPSPQTRYMVGVHGYTPALSDMRAIFFARGPAFKQNVLHDPIKMVDVYQLYTYCLGIAPQPNNGTWSNVAGMLQTPPRQ